ncbi:hypothetical protein PAEPH01_1744 [Pancytospora epiphaga]|nr:hypothetical protein PAEPH01_1744 [Pancytospora epiphaga]
MSNFEVVLESFVPNTQKFIGLLDLTNQRVQNAICKNIQHCYGFLIESSLIYNVFESLLPGTLTVSQFSEFFNERRVNKHAQKQSDKLVVKLYKKATEFFKPKDFIALFVEISRNVIIFNYIKEIAIGDIKNIAEKCIDGIPNGDCEESNVLTFNKTFIPFLANARNIFFYYLGQSKEKDGYFGQKCESYLSLQADNYLSTTTFSGIRADIMSSSTNCRFDSLTELYYRFTIFLSKNTPTIEDILDLPEKFFIAGLSSIKTQTATLLQEFNSNLHNDRIKIRVSQLIDKDILIKYLIVRHIWFDINMDEHVSLMDDKYKLLYASNNLDWAVKNLSEIVKIGIPTSLYDKINKSEHKGCLSGITKRSYSEILEGDSRLAVNLRVQKIMADEYEEEITKRTTSIKNTTFSWVSRDDTIDTDNIMTENTPNTPSYFQPFKTALSPVLENIFSAIKNDDREIGQYFELISSSDDYLYVINSLFLWIQDSKYLHGLSMLFKETLIFYDVKYLSYKEILGTIVKKYDDKSIIGTFASRADFDSILEIIEEYPTDASIIADGVKTTYNRCVTQKHNIESVLSEKIFEVLGSRMELLLGDRNIEDFNKFIRQLVYSNDNASVLVGALVFPCIVNPTFSLSHLLSTTSDFILSAVIESIQPGQHSDELLTLLFTRGVLDSIAALIIERLDISVVSQTDISRIYHLFYISPLNYIKYRIDRLGFSINETIILELISTLPTIYDDDLFKQVSEIMLEYHFEECCFELIIQKLDGCTNMIYKRWAVGCLEGMVSVSLPYFVQLCKILGNEDDLFIVRGIIGVLKNVCSGGEFKGVISGWADKRKLARLVRRVYPLVMENTKWYMRILSESKDEEEVKMLCEVYNMDTC